MWFLLVCPPVKILKLAFWLGSVEVPNWASGILVPFLKTVILSPALAVLSSATTILYHADVSLKSWAVLYKVVLLPLTVSLTIKVSSSSNKIWPLLLSSATSFV